MPTEENTAGPTVAKVFDSLAETYDQTGVAFFGPVGERLVSLLEPATGESALDIGCGRGAATVPLALAVGPEGSVDAVDVAPAMVAGTQALLADRGLSWAKAQVADAARLPALPHAPYDVIASSLVLFFLAEPGSVLRSWTGLLAPGGRIGLTTFGPLDEASDRLDDLLVPFQPPHLRDARTSGMEGPFASDAGMEELMRASGVSSVETVVEPAVIEFADVAAWHRFSMSTGQRVMWMNVPEADRPGVVERAAAILEGTREDGGPCRLVWQMRYTLGRLEG